MNRFYFNGESCSKYGIYVSGDGTFNATELDTTSYQIPGRNGDLVISNGRYKNIILTYPAFIRQNFAANAGKARAWLLSPQGYCRLSDDYHPYEFRLGRFKGPMDFDMRFLNLSGECEISFDCKPQRFLVSGEKALHFDAADAIVNPTGFEALPQIKVYGDGDGTLTCGSTTLTLSAIDEYIVLDSEIQDAYKDTLNRNAMVSGEFPTLQSGENTVSWSGGITGIDITPRWWTL